MKRIKQTERPYLIRYINGGRVLADSATTLEGAQFRIRSRSSLPHNRGMIGEVYKSGALVWSTQHAGGCDA